MGVAHNGGDEEERSTVLYRLKEGERT